MMVWFLCDYLCCFGWSRRHSNDNFIDERTHLIPQAPDEDLFEASLMNQRRLDERLSSIIRDKEGKMVNVASQIPFNLHNRVLPEEPYANSRSASMDMYNSGYDDGMDLRRRGRRQSSQLDRFPPLTPLASRPTSIYDHPLYTRPSSPDSFRETYRREPVLNVKLVGYTPPNRGRSVHRSHGPASPTTPEQGNLPSGGSAASQSADSDGTILAHPVQSNQFRLQDPGLICTSWGD